MGIRTYEVMVLMCAVLHMMGPVERKVVNMSYKLCIHIDTWVQFLFAVSPLRKKASVRIHKAAGYEETHLNADDMNFVRGIPMLRAWCRGEIAGLKFRSATLGKAAPDCRVWDYVSRDQRSLLQYCRPARPLMINFGSCTWAPFMAKFAAFRRMVERFADVADFVVVYTLEAHAIDDWPYPVNKFEVKFHRTLSERFIAAAHLYDQGVPCALLVDDMDDNACLSYATEPERLYVIRDGKVALQGGLNCHATAPGSIPGRDGVFTELHVLRKGQ